MRAVKFVKSGRQFANTTTTGTLNTLMRLSYLALKIQPFLNDSIYWDILGRSTAWSEEGRKLCQKLLRLFFICVCDVSNFAIRCNKCVIMRLCLSLSQACLLCNSGTNLRKRLNPDLNG